MGEGWVEVRKLESFTGHTMNLVPKLRCDTRGKGKSFNWFKQETDSNN